MKNKKTAVITFIDDNMLDNLANDFLPTLRNKANYKGLIFVIYYGNNKKFTKRIEKKYKVKFISFKRKLKIVNQRIFDVIRLLKTLPKTIEQIMYIDGGDVWFQAPIDEIFEKTKKKYGFVEEEKSITDFFKFRCINQIGSRRIRKIFLKKAKNFKLIGGGMIVGYREKVRFILEKTAKLISEINQDFFGLDQAVFNYIIRKYGKGISLPPEYDYSLISRPNQFEIRGGLFYNDKKELINVVHNSGGDSRLFKEGRKSVVLIPKFPKKLPGTFWGITTFFNPAEYKNKIKNYKKFRDSSRKQGLKLLTVELVFRDRPFELKKEDADILIQLRTNSIMWQKERLINVGIENLPKNCDKFAWLDADIIFCNNNWIKETSKLLELYAVVQPFANCIRLPKGVDYMNPDKTDFVSYMNEFGKKGYGSVWRILRLGKGILKKGFNVFGHPGMAWAARREIFADTGVFDRSAFPGLDTFLLFAFYGEKVKEGDIYLSNKRLIQCFSRWQKKIKKKTRESVYYTEGTILHLWHGTIKERNYCEVRRILPMYDFDPDRDIKISSNGCWEWASKKPGLHNCLKNYFFSRNEEGIFFKKIKFSLKSFVFLRRLIEKIYYEKEKQLGLLGIFLKKHSPFIYFKLKKVEILIKSVMKNN